MLDSIYKFKNNLDKCGIIFAFSGPMSHDIVVGIGNALRNKMEEFELHKTISSKIFSIFVEQVQNVINYSEEKAPDGSDMGFGVVVVGKKDDEFFIIGGNKILNTNIERLKLYLSSIQNMNKDELKELYKQKRKEKPAEGSKGGE
jgi:hypothetical protein